MRTGGGKKDGHADPNDVRGIIVSVLRELGVVNGETIKVAKIGGKGPTEAKGGSGKNQKKKKKSGGEAGETSAGCVPARTSMIPNLVPRNRNQRRRVAKCRGGRGIGPR